MLALCLSVHCQSSMAAYVILGMTLIASVIGTAAFAELTGVGGGAFVTATNPLACWLEIAGNGWLRGKLDYPNAAMINLAGYLAAGLYFHVAAHVSFARRAV
jgi:hypothetical protein